MLDQGQKKASNGSFNYQFINSGNCTCCWFICQAVPTEKKSLNNRSNYFICFYYCFTLKYYPDLEKSTKQEEEIFATNLSLSQPFNELFVTNPSISIKWLIRTMKYSHSTSLKHSNTPLFSIFTLENSIIFTQKIHILPAFVAHDKITEKTSPTGIYQSIEHSSLQTTKNTLSYILALWSSQYNPWKENKLSVACSVQWTDFPLPALFQL